MRIAVLILPIFLAGCAQAVLDAQAVYERAKIATERNNNTRLDWREACRQMVLDDFNMWKTEATIRQNDRDFDGATEARKKAAQILKDNFPDLVTVQGLETIIDTAENNELAKVFPLKCYD